MNKSEQRFVKVILDFIQSNLDKVESEDIDNMMKTMEIHNKAMDQNLTTDTARKLYFELLEIIVRAIRTELT